ncbi:MAG TPA: flagellar biosynthesis regulator FlaF [Rhodospirillales bacterium]|jgi:flagellar protein FlaF
MAHRDIDLYLKAQMLAPSPRAVEAQAFSKSVLLLVHAQKHADDYAVYSAALEFNRALWTVLQADVADDANPLPEDVKCDFLSLSLFVDRQTVKALAEPNGDHLTALIAINRDIARGLRARDGLAGDEAADGGSPDD